MSPDGNWQFTPVCNCYNIDINAVARLSSRLFHPLTFLAASGEINLALQLRNIEIPYHLIKQGYTTATSWISKVRSLPARGWFASNVTSNSETSDTVTIIVRPSSLRVLNCFLLFYGGAS